MAQGFQCKWDKKCAVASLPLSYGGVCLCGSQKLWEGKRKGSISFCTKKLTFSLESILTKILILSGSQRSVGTVWIPCLFVSPGANASPALKLVGCETGNNPSPSLRVCSAEGTWFHFLNSEHEFNTAIDKKKTAPCKCLQIEA